MAQVSMSSFDRVTPYAERALRAAQRVPARHAAGAVEVALVLALAYVVASLFWIWATPAGPAVSGPGGAPVPAQATGGEITAALNDFDPFNRDRPGETRTAEAAPVEAAPETMLDLKLTGVRAGLDGDGGAAVIRLPSHDQRVFRPGDEILDGVRLSRVHADFVTLSRRGVAESLFLDDRAKENPGARDTALAATRSGPGAAPAQVSPGAPTRLAAATEEDASGGAAAGTATLPDAGPGTPAVPATDPARAGTGELPRIDDLQSLMSAFGLRPKFTTSRIGMAGFEVGGGANGALLDRVGLRPGDVVTAVEGVPVSDPAGLRALSGRLSSATRVSLVVSRQGRDETVAIDLSEFR